MKVLFSLILVFSVASAQFPDVPSDHWAQDAVAELVDTGVLIGYPDGTFGGEQPVTRYQLALLLTRLRQADTRQDTEAQRALSLLNETLTRLDDLETRLARSEQNVPGVLLLFDEVQANLATLEQGFSRGLLAQQENVLAEVDTRLAALDDALRTAVAEFTDERLGQYDAQVQSRIGELSAQVDALQSEWQTTRDALRAEAQADWTVNLTGYVGVEGEAAQLGGALEARSGQASLQARGFTGETPHATLLSQYAFSDGFQAEGVYLATERGAEASVGLDALLLPPLGLELNGGYGEGVVLGGALYHDPQHPAAVLRGLDLTVAARLAERDGSLQDSLIHAHARLGLGVGGVQLAPAFLYRRVQDEAGYIGWVGELGLGADLSRDVRVAGLVRYGRFDPLGDGTTRTSPEAFLSVSSGAFEVEASLDADLPPINSYPRANDAAPLARDGLVLGLRTGYSITLDGD